VRIATPHSPVSTEPNPLRWLTLSTKWPTQSMIPTHQTLIFRPCVGLFTAVSHIGGSRGLVKEIWWGGTRDLRDRCTTVCMCSTHTRLVLCRLKSLSIPSLYRSHPSGCVRRRPLSVIAIPGNSLYCRLWLPHLLLCLRVIHMGVWIPDDVRRLGGAQASSSDWSFWAWASCR
jgi:hypothetical protein